MSLSKGTLVSLAIAAVALAASPAFGQEAPEDGIRLQPVGSFFSRYEVRENYANETDIVRFRARFGAQSSPFDIGNDIDLKLRFVPQASGFWHVGGDTPGDAALDLHEGFIELGFGDSNSLQAGRFEMAYGDQLVIGPVGWHHAGRAFDGLRWLFRPESGFGLDVFGSLIHEGLVDGTDDDEIGGNDVWFFGAYSMLGGLFDANEDIDLYVLGRLAPRALVDTPNGSDRAPTTLEVTGGLRVKGAAAGADWRTEVDVQGGRRPEARDVSVFAYSADGEVGYTVGDSTTFRFGLNGFIASGDDPSTEDTNEAYFHLYPTAHKWMGLMDYVGARSNVAGGALLLSTQISPRWKAYANIYEFHRLQDTADAASGRLGSELDAGFRFGLGRGTGVRVGYGLFLPDEDISDELFHFAEFELRADLP